MSDEPIFRKSPRSNGTCVEFSDNGDRVLFRDSDMPQGPVLKFTSAEWKVFKESIIAGEL
jgi:Domain of unknown function (DUF397)